MKRVTSRQATRGDGRPAYEHAKPRKRLSDYHAPPKRAERPRLRGTILNLFRWSL